MKLDVVIDAAFMRLLKAAVTALLMGTPVTIGVVARGAVAVTRGGDSGAMRNCHVKSLCSISPSVSVAPVVTVAVQIVSFGRLLAGSKVAMRLSAA
ncbi:MAG TPA: hypothetical protein VLA56_15155 [Pseudomonadales bacterium]|nr:hypothetical protein [Pseudomonadales bacterium]